MLRWYSRYTSARKTEFCCLDKNKSVCVGEWQTEKKNYHTNAIPDSFWEDQLGFDEDIELEEDSYEKQNDTL